MTQVETSKSQKLPVLHKNKDVKIKMIISEDASKMINYLCAVYPREEWSGALFYYVKGDITEPEKMIIEVDDVFLMDLGSKTYTEYESDNRIGAYMRKNIKKVKKGWRVGHIHSHNSMPVYFSNTDDEELQENAPNHNMYVSLIVNTLYEKCAMVAYSEISKGVLNETITIRDKNGDAVNRANSYDYEDEIVKAIPCEIEDKLVIEAPNDWIDERVQVLTEERDVRIEAYEKAKKLAEKNKKQNLFNSGYAGSYNGYDPGIAYGNTTSEPFSYNYLGGESTYDRKEVRMFLNKLIGLDHTITTDTLHSLIKMSNEGLKQFDEYKEQQEAIDTYSQEMLQMFDAIYESQFGVVDHDAVISGVIQECISILYSYIQKYGVICKIIHDTLLKYSEALVVDGAIPQYEEIFFGDLDKVVSI